MDMETKMTLHGPGTYYFSVTGSKEQPIFYSVFEYCYGEQILAQLPHSRLLAYVFNPYEIQCVLHCDHDWTHVMDDLHRAFDHMHEQCWQRRHQVLSDQSTVLLVDDSAYLVDLVLQLHRWPVLQQLVADAEVYPWSSDRYYRLPEPPAWLDSRRMLNWLCHSRRNQAQHYEAVMRQPARATLNLLSGNHPMYQALARDGFIQRFLKKEALSQAARSAEEIRTLYDHACQLVSDQFGTAMESMRDPLNRRDFHRFMPIVVWLLRERGLHFDDIARLVGEDEERLQLWLRNLPADHEEALLRKLMQRWSPTDIPVSGVFAEA
ncbi:hypothetical protein CHH28_12445 [Bacterioplanes sanyensis]|uniref:Uncharacterized protein n=1 Tax=Bacterioplanes sanyensis TaxID=1249553 RepID=A0A222FL90_9GAMM|nr:hypothetical protein [Bacterioplanes sanyensis]ASP39432.1 hypothetical protein CHH28_12445 [Bacterioplanes sanyensis]